MEESAVATRPETGKEVVGIPVMTFTREQVELVKRTVAKDATDDELALFLHTCKRTGLDPLAKQIHFVKRNTRKGPVAAFQTAIDGYRLVADRTGKYAGNDDPVFKDGDGHPESATVTVYKMVGGGRCSFTATARWSEYFPGEEQGFMWKKMPYLMLGKCAEGLALRKAFPAELSGVYTDDEMQQADGGGGHLDPILSPRPKKDKIATFTVEKITTTEKDKKTVYCIYIDGVRYETLDKATAEACKKWAEDKTPVIFTAEGVSLVEICKA